MSKHLQRDLENVQREILALSPSVEESIDKASRALCERRLDLAQQVLQADDEIDRREVEPGASSCDALTRSTTLLTL